MLGQTVDQLDPVEGIASINLVKDQEGWTALHWATSSGDLQATKLLKQVIHFYFDYGTY